MLVKTQNYVISVYRFNVMLVKTQNYLISVYRCNMLVKTQNYSKRIFVRYISLPTSCNSLFHFFTFSFFVFPVLAKILKYVILNPFSACVGMVLVAQADSLLKKKKRKRK